MNQLRERGWTVFEEAIDPHLIEWMRVELAEAYALCRAIQVRNGIDNAEHTVHHLVGQGRSWLTLLEEMPNACIREFFGGPFILNSLGGNINPAGTNNYAGVIHRDIRSYLQDAVMLNAIVTLDDFTAENGATWIMNGGHQFFPDRPEPELFHKLAEQIICPVGSVILFDSRCWHRAGVNRSGGPRRIVTPMYSRPFMKPQFDYCAAVGNHIILSDELQQIIGFNARIPATLDEWYQPREKRCYLLSQG